MDGSRLRRRSLSLAESQLALAALVSLLCGRAGRDRGSAAVAAAGAVEGSHKGLDPARRVWGGAETRRPSFKSASTTALVCDGNEAQIYGVGTVNGQTVNYWIDATDTHDFDYFRISWIGDNVPLYDSLTGVVGGGNITIH